jgi:hypothetical protein
MNVLPNRPMRSTVKEIFRMHLRCFAYAFKVKERRDASWYLAPQRTILIVDSVIELEQAELGWEELSEAKFEEFELGTRGTVARAVEMVVVGSSARIVDNVRLDHCETLECCDNIVRVLAH